jgi:uncharacterized protein (DUF1499 family)
MLTGKQSELLNKAVRHFAALSPTREEVFNFVADMGFYAQQDSLARAESLIGRTHYGYDTQEA